MIEFKHIFLLLFIPHILGDFYFQNDYLARKKEKSLKWTLIHCLIYGLSYYIFIRLISISFNIIYIITMIIFHILIDTMKYYIIKYTKHNLRIFIFDQLLHILSIILISYLYMLKNNDIPFNNFLINFINMTHCSIYILLSYFCKILLIYKPANIFISLFMNPYKPSDNTNSTINAGRVIGALERTIMLFFISIYQYSSVGLVLTAKSIARYDKISKDQAFAEYYLLGTLLSTITVLIISLL